MLLIYKITRKSNWIVLEKFHYQWISCKQINSALNSKTIAKFVIQNLK
jgi:hypothetical protein